MTSNHSWDEQMSVGVAEIDAEHQEIFFLIQRLQLAMKRSEPGPEVDLILKSLADYALTHFSTEESYFQETCYPQADSHCLEHRRFERKVNQFKRVFDAGDLRIADQILSHLRDWLTKHIEGTDKQFAAYLLEQ